MANLEEIEKEWEVEYKNADIENIPLVFLKPPSHLVKLIEQNKIKKGKILDIGCGLGVSDFYLAAKGFQTLGLDVSKTAIEYAKKKAEQMKLKCEFIKGFAQDLKLTDKSFTFVFDRGCFHHIEPEDREEYIQGIHRVLEDKGKYYLECYSEKNQKEVFAYKFSKEELQKYFSKFKIEYVEEVENVSVDGEKVFLYSVFMEKI